MNLVPTHIASLTGLHLPPRLALLLTVGFVFFLFRRDVREQPNVTSALWIPLVWVLLMGSRSVAQWLYILHIPIALGSSEEGNPLDAVVYFSLIIAGLCVLNQRQVSLSEVLQNNGWLMVFLLYCFIAITWSDFPFVAFKRWIKVLGHPIIALVVLTEPDFDEALARLMKRSAYILLTFSILALKYYPEIGRGFDQWTGEEMNIGITQGKNSLGGDCLVVGFFFVWRFLRTWRTEKSKSRRDELWLLGVLLFMAGYLLRKSHDATATLCLLIAIAVMFFAGRRWVNKRLIGTYAVLAIITLVVAELTFGIFGRVVDLTGHNTTMMGRMDLWRELLALHTNPIFGTGFESFWLGDRLKALSEAHWWHPNSAHNGYLEIYLSLGSVGLLILVGVIVATFRKIRLELLRNFEWGRFRLGFLVAVVFFNVTEASFRGLSLVFFVFFIIAMEYPRLRSTAEESEFDFLQSEEEMDAAFAPGTVHN